MYIGQFTYLDIVRGANDAITKACWQNHITDEFRAEALKEVQKWFWNWFHRNGVGYSNWHSHRFICGQITDTRTNSTWPCDSYGKKIGGKLTMSLPTYDKTKRKKSFQQLPKGAYVVRIMNAKEEQWPSGDGVVRIAFDIAEGEYKDFYQKMFDSNPNEDKKWPIDAVFNLNVPNDKSPVYVWQNWNSFFADLEDSNGGFVFGGDVSTLRGKVIGGLFHIRQTQGDDGTVYDHTSMRWTRTADDVRDGKFGKLPKDKLIDAGPINDTGFDPVKEAIPF